MAQPLRLSIGVNIDAAGAKTGGAEAQQAVAGIGNEAQRTQTKLQALINSTVGLNTSAANGNLKEWSGALAMQGRSVDELRAKYNPLFAVVRSYKQQLTEIRTLHAQGVLSSNEMVAAISRERQATLASIEAIKGRGAALRQAAANANGVSAQAGHAVRGGNAAFQTANLAAQAQDTVVTALMGMPSWQIGMQQGLQAATVIGTMEKPIQGLAAAFASIISPISLVTIGLTAGTAALIQYFATADDGTDGMSKALREQAEFIASVASAWGDATPRMKAYADEMERAAKAAERLKAGETLAREQYVPVEDTLGGLRPSFSAAQRELTGFGADTAPALKMMTSAVTELQTKILAGTATTNDLSSTQRALAETLERTGTPAVRRFVDEFGRVAPQIQAALEAARQFRQEGSSSIFPALGILAGRFSEGGRLFAPEEFIPNGAVPTPISRPPIELEGLPSQQQLADARRDRIRSMTEAVEGQQLELTLIGKTVSEAERLRMEHRLTAQAKAEAAKNGVEVDREELRLIAEKSRAYGQLAEEIATTNILRGQQSSLEQLRLETALVGQSEETRRRALALMQAEQQIRQQGITADSARADQIRKASLAIADQTAEVERLRDAWGEVQGAIEGVVDGGVDALTKGDWKGALDALKKEIVGSLSTIGIKNPLMNAIDGGNRGTISDLGGIGGLVSRLLGGGRADATSLVTRAMGQSVGAMTVTAGTVMINGGVSGSLLGGLKGLVPGNDNAFTPNTTLSDMLGLKGAGGALGFVGRYKSGVDPRLTDILQEAASRFPGFKVDAISGYRPGDPRYHGGGLATDVQLTDLASGRLLGNYQNAASFHTYEQFAQVSRQIQMAKYPELADKFRWGGYFSGGPGKYGALDTMHFDLGGGGMAGGSWAGGLTSAQASLWPGIQSQGMAAADALEKLAGQGDIAAQGLGALGNGFGKFGNVLAGLGNGGGASGGGLMGLFGNLFSPSFTPNTTLGSFIINGFSGGGPTGGNDPSRVAGLVHEKEFVFDAPATARIGVHNLEAIRRGAMRGYRDGGYVGSRIMYPVAAMAPVRQEAAAPVIQIVNNSSAQVDGRIEDAGTDERGRRQYRMVMSDAVADGLSTPGGRAGRTLRDTYNVRKRGIAR